MTVFDETCRIGDRGLAAVLGFIQVRAAGGRYVTTYKGRLARDLQRTVGDVLFNDREDRIWACEVKTEQVSTGNLFLETFSNRMANPPVMGWLYTLNTDLLLYFFEDRSHLVVLPFCRLRRWAFGVDRAPGMLGRYHERSQVKWPQRNETVGHLVPIADLEAARLAVSYVYGSDGLWIRCPGKLRLTPN